MLLGHTLADKYGTILAADEKVCDWLHRARTDLIGRNYLEITVVEDRAWNRRQVDALSAEAEPLAIRKRYMRPDRSMIWASVLISRLAVGPDAGQLVGTLHSLPASKANRLWQAARRERLWTKSRSAEFGAWVGGDQAWSATLELYLAEIEARPIDAEAVAERLACSLVMACRWLNTLQSEGLAEPAAAGLPYWQLTSVAVSRVERLLKHRVVD